MQRDGFRYGVSAALEELPATQPVTLRGSMEELCRQASELGYDALELHVRNPNNLDAKTIRATADHWGIPICAVANGMEYTVNGLSLIDDDEAARERAIQRILEHADFAAELGARLIVGIMRGNIPRGGDSAQYLQRFAGALDRICDYARQRQVDVVLESIVRYINNYLNGVPETIDFIAGLGHDNLSLHLDTHSMAVEEQNLRESVLYCLGRPLGYVHYSDNNRLYPGGGALDFRPLTDALVEIGYQGYITVECLPLPNPIESARRGLQYMKGVEQSVLVEREFRQMPRR